DRALQSALLTGADAAGHQALCRGPGQAPQRAERDAPHEPGAVAGHAEDDEADGTGAEPAEQSGALAEAGDERPHQPTLHDGAADPYQCQRQADFALAPAVAIA